MYIMLAIFLLPSKEIAESVMMEIDEEEEEDREESDSPMIGLFLLIDS